MFLKRNYKQYIRNEKKNWVKIRYTKKIQKQKKIIKLYVLLMSVKAVVKFLSKIMQVVIILFLYVLGSITKVCGIKGIIIQDYVL